MDPTPQPDDVLVNVALFVAAGLVAWMVITAIADFFKERDRKRRVHLLNWKR